VLTPLRARPTLYADVPWAQTTARQPGARDPQARWPGSGPRARIGRRCRRPTPDVHAGLVDGAPTSGRRHDPSTMPRAIPRIYSVTVATLPS